MPKINYILLIYRNLFLTPIHASKLLLLNSLMEFLGTNTDIHLLLFLILCPPPPVGDYRWSTCVLFRKATVLCISLYITISSLTNGTSLR